MCLYCKAALSCSRAINPGETPSILHKVTSFWKGHMDTPPLTQLSSQGQMPLGRTCTIAAVCRTAVCPHVYSLPLPQCPVLFLPWPRKSSRFVIAFRDSQHIFHDFCTMDSISNFVLCICLHSLIVRSFWCRWRKLACDIMLAWLTVGSNPLLSHKHKRQPWLTTEWSRFE